jgi:hypothetical protein
MTKKKPTPAPKKVSSGDKKLDESINQALKKGKPK